MTYLLDTNVVSDLMRGDLRIANWLEALPEDDLVVTCTIVRGEILFGLARLAESKRRTDLEIKAQQLFDVLPCEVVPERASDFYAIIKLSRQRRGLTLDENDLWVAATTLAIQGVLVSRDTDFAAIEGLSVFAPF